MGMAVVMPLLFAVACSGDRRETVDVAFDPEHSFTMKTSDVSTLVSDSGITRYRANAKEWLIFGKAKEPYWLFPQGLYLERFDTLFNGMASMKADTAWYYPNQELWKGVGNVEMENLEGERFYTSLLFWNQKTQRIYSDQYIRIERKDRTLTGIGFDSDQSMTQYKIFKPGAEFIIDEAPPDTVRPADSPSEALSP
ncbi:MAG: LPS export ABC transporter periplasmic protein LptC [Bacteroidales bacterium]